MDSRLDPLLTEIAAQSVALGCADNVVQVDVVRIGQLAGESKRTASGTPPYTLAGITTSSPAWTPHACSARRRQALPELADTARGTPQSAASFASRISVYGPK